jgi:hypothetical protein
VGRKQILGFLAEAQGQKITDKLIGEIDKTDELARGAAEE